MASSDSDSEQSFRDKLERAKRQSVSHALLKAGRLVDTIGLARMRQKLGAPNLRSAHLRLFPHIDLDGTRVTTVAERMGVSKQAVAVLVDELVGMDVLTRVPAPDDGRARLISFVRRPGRSLLDGMALLGDIDAELEQCLGTTRMSRLRRDIHELTDHLQALASPAGDSDS